MIATLMLKVLLQRTTKKRAGIAESSPLAKKSPILTPEINSLDQSLVSVNSSAPPISELCGLCDKTSEGSDE